MASSNYTYDKSNSFFSTLDDDVDDATFLKGSRAYESSSVEQRRLQLLEERRKIEDRTVQSSMRSVSLLHQSEEIGNATAQELVRQREQLESTEQKLDDINSSLRTSQKHIQGIKSVFGSIKNYFAGNKNESKPLTSASIDEQIDKLPRAQSELSKILESQSISNPIDRRSDDPMDHPSLRLRAESAPSSKDVNEILDRNLEDMGNSLANLRGFGLGLQKELDDQNTLIRRITTKTEDSSFRIEHQNKDMNRIIKK